MKRKILSFVACFLIVSIMRALPQEARPAPPPGMPAAAGVYYLQGPGKWVKLDPAFVDESKIRGMGAYMQTEGLTGLNLNYVYLGISAPLQLSEPRPVFYVRGVGSVQEVQLVRLSQGKENRTVRTSSTEVSVGNKGGFKRSEIRQVAAVVFSDGSFSATPEQDLKSGEYLLALGSAMKGFDFGSTAGKK
jgi:hypothetical protein